MSGFGSTPWGSGAWGSGGPGAITLLTAQAYRENVIRLVFNNPVYFSTILDPADASDLSHYTLSIVDGTSGYDGNPVRDVDIVATEMDKLATPHVVDLILDRPMTPYPAQYTLTVTDIFSADLSSNIPTATFTIEAVFRKLKEPTVDVAIPSRDIANPQTLMQAIETSPNPLLAALGTFTVDDSGDYAFDEGIQNLKKRIFRRLVTSVGGFAHLPDYGVGFLEQGKKLGTTAVQNELCAAAESQISAEPDVAQAKVRVVKDLTTQGLFRFRILVKPKSGQPQAFDVPFHTSN